MRNNDISRLPPKEYIIFKQLCEEGVDHITLESLLNAYNNVIMKYGIKGLTDMQIVNLVSGIKISNESLFWSHDQISFRGFSLIYKQLRSILIKYDSPIRPSLALKKYKPNIRKYSIICISLLMDAFAITLLYLSKTYPTWIFVARSFAVIILINLCYILIPLIGVANLFPDSVLINIFPCEYTHTYHSTFGIKIILASIGHIIGHIGQIEKALRECKNGCSRDYIKIVPKSDSQIVISRGFFVSQYAYASGIVLTILMGSLGILLLFRKYIRFSVHQLLHKSLGIFIFIMIIAHGFQQLLGFNLSIIFTLPLLICYMWKHRKEVFHSKIRIDRWVITPSIIRLYLQENPYLQTSFGGFNVVSIYVNYSDISKFEWHPFTLSRNHNYDSCILTMKRVGEWTNKLANALANRIHFQEYLNIGNVTQSQFRFHKFYKARYFFCAGIGITSFISAMEDTLKLNYQPPDTTLIWSISDVNILREFNEELTMFQQNMPDLKILIYYSNRGVSKKPIDNVTRLRFNLLQAIIHTMYKIDIFAGISDYTNYGVKLPVCCILQRADIYAILEGAIWKHKTLKSEIGVFICGSHSYGDIISEYVNMLEKNEHNVSFRVWTETC